MAGAPVRAAALPCRESEQPCHRRVGGVRAFLNDRAAVRGARGLREELKDLVGGLEFRYPISVGTSARADTRRASAEARQGAA